MNWLIELVDWFLPESVWSAEEETLRQARVTVGSIFLFFLVAPISAYFYTSFGFSHVIAFLLGLSPSFLVGALEGV